MIPPTVSSTVSEWSWLADVGLALLLAGTLGMVIRLDRALRVVRRDRGVFEALIKNLGAATHSVKLGIQALRDEADRAAEQIARRTEDADKMATELSFLIEAAERASDRLDARLQPEAASASPSAPTPPAQMADDGGPAEDVDAALDGAAPPTRTAWPTTDRQHAIGDLRELAGITTRRRVRGGEWSGASETAGTGQSRALAR